MICIFPQNSFQRILVIFCLLVPDVLKILSFFYNGFTISSLVLFLFRCMTFGVFDIICFRLALKTLDIGRFSWWMCCKNEIRTKVLSLKSSSVSKFYPYPLKLCTCRETCPWYKNLSRISIKEGRWLKLIK